MFVNKIGIVESYKFLKAAINFPYEYHFIYSFHLRPVRFAPEKREEASFPQNDSRPPHEPRNV